MPSQFDFPADFQNLILACYIRHTEEFSRYGPLLDPAYFQGSVATTAARAVQKFFASTGRYPGWITLKQMVAEDAKRRGDDEEEKAIEYVDELKAIETDDWEYVITRLRDFARHRAVMNQVRDLIVEMKEGKEPTMDICGKFEAALNVGADLEDDGVLLHSDFERVVDEVTKADYGVRTGFPQLDKIWRRGWCPGWLVVPLAPPKRYKSLFISQLALNMVSPSIGEDILYYPCEISQSLALVRMLHRITELDVNELYESTTQFKAKARERINQVVAGNLLVKGYPAKTVTVRDIEAHANRVIKRYKLKPKAIFIDYAETILSSSGDKVSEHQAQAQVYVDARAMGARLGCAVVMPDRCNKETVGQAVPSMKSFQGSFQKAGVVDAAIGLCASDLEYKRAIQRTFVFLNRHGAAFQHFRGKVDANIMSYDVGEETEYEPDEDDGTADGGSRGRRRPRGGSEKVPDDLVE